MKPEKQPSWQEYLIIILAVFVAAPIIEILEKHGLTLDEVVGLAKREPDGEKSAKK